MQDRMRLMVRYVLFAIFIAIGMVQWACLSRSDVPPQENSGTVDKKKIFEHANKLSTAHNELQIEGYIRRNGLDSILTDGRGMYYKVWGSALGAHPRDGVHVVVAYTLELLDGTLCERTDTINPLELTIGKRKQTVGFEELLLHLAPGQQAIGIVPPHLGYGIVGKGDVIPPHSVLVYKVTWMRYPKQ